MFFFRPPILTLLFALLLAPVALRAQEQDTTVSVAAVTDTAADLAPAVDTTPLYAPEPSDATQNLSLEDRMRQSQHALYDTLHDRDGATQDMDYANRWDRDLGDNAKQKMQEDKALNYDTKPKKPSAFIVWLRKVMDAIFINALYILLGATLVLVLLYVLLTNDITLFRRKAKPVGTVEETETVTVNEDLATANFEKLLQQAMGAGNWTAATRYHYLYTLQQLHAKGLVLLGQHKTNRDYLRDVTNTRWYKPFSHLTREYEYVCYGHFELSGSEFEQLHAQFNAFKQDLQQS